MPTPTRKLNPMTDTAQRDEIKALRGELRDERLRSTVFERQYRQACSDHATAMAELASLRERLAKAEGLLHANGTPRFNEAMRRADAAEARALLAESKLAEAKGALALWRDSRLMTEDGAPVDLRLLNSYGGDVVMAASATRATLSNLETQETRHDRHG